MKQSNNRITELSWAALSLLEPLRKCNNAEVEVTLKKKKV